MKRWACVANVCTHEILCCEASKFWEANQWQQCCILHNSALNYLQFPERQHFCESMWLCSYLWSQNLTSALKIVPSLRKTLTCSQTFSLLMWKDYRRMCSWSLLKCNMSILSEVATSSCQCQRFTVVWKSPDLHSSGSIPKWCLVYLDLHTYVSKHLSIMTLSKSRLSCPDSTTVPIRNYILLVSEI